VQNFDRVNVCIQYTCIPMYLHSSKTIQLSWKSTILTIYTIGSLPITKVDNHCNLGIILSSNLSWEPHFQHIISKAYKMLDLLQRTFSAAIPADSKKQLYISLIWSQFMYCSVLWKPYLVKHIQLIEHLQWWATKYILNDYTSDCKSEATYFTPYVYFRP